MSTCETWTTLEGFNPGYLGKNKDQVYKQLDVQYQPNNWRVAWRLNDGRVLSYEEMFYLVFVASYVSHFFRHPGQVDFITRGYAYSYDKDLVTKEQAFDPFALYNKPGQVNQIHHVGINIALERFLRMNFKGTEPLQVREGKSGSPQYTWPQGYSWSPGRIQAARPDLTPKVAVESVWPWQKGSIEEQYQHSKIFQIESSIV